MNKKYYTGVGSRKTPQQILDFMCEIAKYLQSQEYTLRSGGADGADKAFENGVGLAKQIFYAKDSTPQAEAIAAQFHPAWNRCSAFAKRLHGRNSFQVLGPELNVLSEFLICWTPDGCKRHVDRTINTGWTGTAISIADAHDIPVYNLATKGDRLYWEMAINKPEMTINKPKVEVPIHKLKYIYTAHYRYGGPDRTDITVKGKHPMGHYFAPTWDIVKGVKDGTIQEQEYIDRYIKILQNAPTKAWNWLLSEETRTFVCFCPRENFCHRNILTNYIMHILHDVKYMGWSEINK